MVGNKPIKSFKAGAIYASIFENDVKFNGADSKTYKVIVKKMYKDSKGEWSSTYSFSGYTEIPKVLLLLEKCYEFLAMNMIKENNASNESGVSSEHNQKSEQSY